MIDLIVCDNTFYAKYWSQLTDLQRFSDDKTAGLGFQNLRFNSAPVVADAGANSYGEVDPGPNIAPAGTAPVGMYFLNCDYIFLRPHKNRNMMTRKGQYSINQDAYVQLIFWAGNLTMSNAGVQGRINHIGF